MRVLLVWCVVVAVAGCDRPGIDRIAAPPDGDCTLWRIRVSPASATLHPGDSLSAMATVNQCQGVPSSTAVRWRSTDTATAIVDALTGLVRARASGPVTIVATVVDDTTITGAMALTVVPR
jgi:hypothetical protein